MRFLVILGIFVLVVLFGLKRVEAAEQPIVIDPGVEYQTIEGFGASGCWWAQAVGGWEDELQNKIVRLLFDRDEGIGLTMYRYNIGGGDGENIADRWRRAETFEIAPGQYDWTRDANAVRIMKAAHQAGVEQIIAFVNSPPARMTVSGKTSGGNAGASNLRPDMVNDFAQYMVDIVRHLREDEGLPVTWISPINEPQWDWGKNEHQEGCHYEPAEILAVTKATIKAFAASGLPVKVSAPEAGEWKNISRTYLEQMMNEPEIAAGLEHFAIHSYWSNTNDKIYFMKAARQMFPALRFWMTEWTEMQSGRDAGMESAVTLAYTMHDDLTICNVTSWQYWIAVSRYDYRDGLIYVDEQPQPSMQVIKRLWAMGNFSRFIRPGYVRVDAQGAQVLFGVSAYRSPDQKELVVVVVNGLTIPVTKTLCLADDSTFRQATMFETSDVHDLTEIYTGARPEAWTFPRRSVTTIVLK